MDFSQNTVLKENYTFLTADQQGQVAGGEQGLYSRDTRFLNRYRWRFSPHLQCLLLDAPQPDRLSAHYALLQDQRQVLAVRRELRLFSGRLVDRLELEVTGGNEQQLLLELDSAADFADLFEVRGWEGPSRQVRCIPSERVLRYTYRSRDGLLQAAELEFSHEPEWQSDGAARFTVELLPGERRIIEVECRVHSPLEPVSCGLSYPEWRQRFTGLKVPIGREPLVRRAIDDLRALLIFTEDGPVPAAGIPWYVAAFGRDALLTAAMLLPWAPDVAEATLRYLARYQGKVMDDFRAESPGKIMHELRFGELTRLGRAPHNPYYGTVDATPLYLVVLHRLWRSGGRTELIHELRPTWEAALTWMVQEGDRDGDAFLEFTPAAAGQGLTVQSWKDSHDSMSHASGDLASGRLAVSEVQGYAFEAYQAAAHFYRELGEPGLAQQWEERSVEMRRRFHEAFWQDDLGTYAMALDGEKRPLAVHNSNAGQLLWSGIVPPQAAPRLVATLFSNDNWSGWGFRTLGKAEKRYNPVSYHNGSVWPHDSALIAAGLARYGFWEEAFRVREALLDLAASQSDLRLPELVGGYARRAREAGTGWLPPVPYPVACRPQAWDSAALIYLLSLD